MNTLPFDQAVSRFKENEERVDIFANDPNNVGFYLTNETPPRQVQSLLYFMSSMVARYLAYSLKGNWITAIAYEVQDIVLSGGIAYMCLVEHTSGAFATDLAAGKWAVYQGISPSVLAQGDGASLVGFLPSGTGAVLRTSEQKHNEHKTPYDFGAIGNGTADDTEEVQKAIDSGKPIDFQNGIFRITAKLNFSQAGIKYFSNGATLLFDGDTTERLANITADNVMFENITFSGNEKQPKTCLIYISDNVKRPRFHNCTFKKLTGKYWGTSVLNAMYALNISPYGVIDFEFKNCKFEDIIKYNDGVNTIPVTPAFVGGGFTGGICFLQETMSEPTVAQTAVTQGIVESCVFSNIQTIRANGLNDADAIEFNDADAIITYGYTGGGESLFVNVSNCIFRNVSKRCFKFRASGSIAKNNECYAADLPYSMTSPVDLTSNSSVINLKIFASSAKPVYNAITWSVGPNYNNEALIDGLFVSHCKNGINFFSSPAQQSLDNFTIRNSKFANCVNSGIVQSAPLPHYMTNFCIQDTQIIASGDSCIGISTAGPSGSPYSYSSGVKVENVYIKNANVYMGGIDNSVSNLQIEISSNAFVASSPSAALCRIGDVNYGGFQSVDNLFINAWNLNSSFMNATRQFLNILIGDNACFKNIRIKVPETLGVTYAHLNSWGREVNFEGLRYDGPGRVHFGTDNPSVRFSISDATRLSNNGSPCTESFIYTNNVGTSQVMIDNVIDFRPTNQPTIIINNGSQFIVYNVGSKTSNATIVQHGGLAKVANINTF